MSNLREIQLRDEAIEKLHGRVSDLERAGNRLLFVLDHTPAIPVDTALAVTRQDVAEATYEWLRLVPPKGNS